MFKLIKGGEVFAPRRLGKRDILLCGERILQIGEDLRPPAGFDCEVIDAEEKQVAPGFVDGHIHLLGAGGGMGPESRSYPLHLSTYAKAGVTTAVGVLGIDCIGFTLEELLIRARQLEMEGLSTYILSGSFAEPSATITGGITKDLYLIDKVVGLKIAMREAVKCSPSRESLRRLISETVLGGHLGGKAGVVVSHLGDAPGSLAEVADVLDELLVPQRHFVATHINRSRAVLDDAIPCGRRGMIMDLTGNFCKDEKIMPSKALRILLDGGVPLENITFSSDSGAAFTWKGEKGILPVDICAEELRVMVREEGFTLAEALLPLTSTPARVYGLDARKGALAPGMDADILLLDGDLRVDTVLARGRVLLRGGRPEVRGRLELPTLELLR